MKYTGIAFLIGATFIGMAVALTHGGLGTPDAALTTPANNVRIEDGKQFIDISAKGGYSPRTSTAKAGIPTVLRVATSGTFDCSSFIRIPSIGYSKALPQTGTTDIDLGTPKAGVLQGMCGMGMYPFRITFED